MEQVPTRVFELPRTSVSQLGLALSSVCCFFVAKTVYFLLLYKFCATKNTLRQNSGFNNLSNLSLMSFLHLSIALFLVALVGMMFLFQDFRIDKPRTSFLQRAISLKKICLNSQDGFFVCFMDSQKTKKRSVYKLVIIINGLSLFGLTLICVLRWVPRSILV